MATDPSATPSAPPGQPGAAPPPPPITGQAWGNAPPFPQIESNQDERQMAMVAHIGGVLPFLGFLVPLAIWATKMGQSKFIEDQAKEALNFQINVAMITLIASFTVFIYIGYILFPSVLLTNIIWCFIAGTNAQKGVAYRYPLNVRYLT